jgi:hypothetical protein
MAVCVFVGGGVATDVMDAGRKIVLPEEND